ncbi:MAG TPA: hypothetical protein VFN56_01550 [Candidatus Saccharimonadales bacterium]|nr:hypothetical protein [Candidatus Saccharimonadales bacterium]
MTLRGTPHINTGDQPQDPHKKRALRRAALGMFTAQEIAEFKRQIALRSKIRRQQKP